MSQIFQKYVLSDNIIFSNKNILEIADPAQFLSLSNSMSKV